MNSDRRFCESVEMDVDLGKGNIRVVRRVIVVTQLIAYSPFAGEVRAGEVRARSNTF